MLDKDPMAYEWLTYLWVLALSFWGGLAGYIRKVKNGQAEKFSFLEMIGELVISGFAGVVTFWLGELAELPPLLTGALVGIAGHMGSRAIALFEDRLKRKFGIRS